jgi:hypothetical protein
MEVHQKFLLGLLRSPEVAFAMFLYGSTSHLERITESNRLKMALAFENSKPLPYERGLQINRLGLPYVPLPPIRRLANTCDPQVLAAAKDTKETMRERPSTAFKTLPVFPAS